MTNPNFTASISTNELYRDLDTTVCLTDLLDGYDASIDAIESEIDDLGNTYALVGHTHDEYATTDSVSALQDAISNKADSTHTHTEYAAVDHSHDGYAATNHSHDYAAISHNHDDVYYTESEVDSQISTLNTAISGKAASSHTHTIANVTNLQSSLDAKVPTSRTINGKALTANITLSASDVSADASGTAATQAAAALQSAKDYADDQIEALGDTYYTETEIDSMVSTINAAVSGKADASHTHTVDTALSGTSTNPVQNKVINSALAGKANTSHGNHVPATQTANNAVFLRNDNSWQTVTPANIGAYTKSEIDSKVSTLNTAINGKAAASHSHDDRYYTESEIDAKFDAIIGEGASTTLDTIGEISSAIEDNQDMLETLNSAIGTKANASDLTSHTGNKSNPHSVTASQVGAYTKAEVDSKLSGKADSGHTHTVDSSLSSTSTNPVQNKVVKSALDSKANTSHGNHVPATQTADNTKFLRNDNTWQSVTPSNIGAYTKAEIDSKVSTLNTAINGKAASNHTHSAYVNQNAFSNVKVGTTTVAADSTTDTLELAGSNVTITPDATNDKVTIGITKANVTSALGYTPPTTNTTYNAATASAAGLMSAADKSKLDGIASGANKITVDSALSATSTNPVQNKVINSALSGKAASSHTHNYAGSSSAGGSATSANKLNTDAGDVNTPVYFSSGIPVACTSLDLSTTGNAATATKLETARTISLTGDVTGSASFDGTGNVSIAATVADDSHNHTIANVDGLQTALDAKSASDHTHTAAALISMADALFGTNYQGGVEYSYGSGSGKNVLTEISNMPQGFHTIYSIAGTTGNPETTESYRYFIHKTSTTIGWIYAFGADGSIYSNYLAGANTFKGWRTIHDTKRKPLWTGSYYMTAGHTATPSKKLSQCEHGWMLLWSDYDPDTSTVNNSDFCTTMIPNRNWAGNTWNGSSFYCDVPRYSAGTATDSESRVIKLLNVYDNKLVGSDANNAAPRNDVVLRCIYEF